ncbi:MAG: hypothetical protein GY759_20265 [Chloroflexi bacterium]|nr:hypothetical protein [Chloroflexota bacterium]
MNGKERVLATLNRQAVDQTPLDCWLYQRQFLDMLEAEYGPRERFLDEFNISIFTGWTPYPNQLGCKVKVDELGTLDIGDPADPKWITHRDWNPDFAALCVVDAVQQQGDTRAIVAHMWGIVEGTSTLMGIEKCWASLRKKPELMTAWFDRYADWLCGLADSCIEAGADIIQMSDDWGSNNIMLFSPEMWRRMIRPYSERVIKHVRSRDIPFVMHSDGYIMDIMDDIVDMGVSVLHPVQESAGMHPKTIKDRYGDRLVVYGSLDTVDGLILKDEEALDQYITEKFEIYAPGGGFIFTTGHFVQPDTPPQRLIRAYTLANKLAANYRSSEYES